MTREEALQALIEQGLSQDDAEFYLGQFDQSTSDWSEAVRIAVEGSTEMGDASPREFLGTLAAVAMAAGPVSGPGRAGVSAVARQAAARAGQVLRGAGTARVGAAGTTTAAVGAGMANDALPSPELPSVDIGSGSDSEPEDPARERAEARLEEQGIDPDSPEGQRFLFDSLVGGLLPGWVRDIANQAGVPLDQDFVDEMMDEFGVSSPEALGSLLDVGDPAVMARVQDMLPIDEVSSIGVNMGLLYDNQYVYVDQSEVSDVLTRFPTVQSIYQDLIRYSNAGADTLRDTGRGYRSPEAPDFSVLAAAAAANGLGADALARIDNEVEAIRQVPAGPGMRTGPEVRREARDRAARVAARDIDRLARRVPALAKRYNGNPVLAILATTSGGMALADRVFNAPESLTSQDQARLAQFIAENNIDRTQALMWGTNPAEYDFIELLANEGAAGADPMRDVTVPVPSESEMNEQLSSVWKAWFGREPDESQLSSFRSSVVGGLTSAARAQVEASGAGTNPFEISRSRGRTWEVDPRANAIGGAIGAAPELDDPERPGGGVRYVESVNPGQMAMDQARQSPLYDELFGAKPEGLTEEQYVAQFSSQAARLMGNEQAPRSALDAGMRRNDVNETSRAIFWSDEAQDNSTFQGRLANVLSLVDRRT